MVGINATQIVNVQSHPSVIHKPAEELNAEINIKITHPRPRKWHIKFQARATRKVDHNPWQSFIQSDIGVAIAGNTSFVAYRLSKSLTQGNAYILNGMVIINMGITIGDDF